jgi:Fe-S-cluster-containing dehydrogenase component
MIMTTKRYAMAVDMKKCVGCSACIIVCKEENNVPLHHYRDWIEQELTGEYPHLFMDIRSQRCNHCSEPPCVGICPTGASWITKDGIVLVNTKKCIGCKACITACPYDARYVHPKGYIDKCTFCAHRLEKGLKPACVEICPTSSLVFGDIHDPESEISKVLGSRKYIVNHAETGCKPNLYFLE